MSIIFAVQNYPGKLLQRALTHGFSTLDDSFDAGIFFRLIVTVVESSQGLDSEAVSSALVPTILENHALWFPSLLSSDWRKYESPAVHQRWMQSVLSILKGFLFLLFTIVALHQDGIVLTKNEEQCCATILAEDNVLLFSQKEELKRYVQVICKFYCVD